MKYPHPLLKAVFFDKHKLRCLYEQDIKLFIPVNRLNPEFVVRRAEVIFQAESFRKFPVCRPCYRVMAVRELLMCVPVQVRTEEAYTVILLEDALQFTMSAVDVESVLEALTLPSLSAHILYTLFSRVVASTTLMLTVLSSGCIRI